MLLSALGLKLGVLADECSESSVLVVSIVRLKCLTVHYFDPIDFFRNGYMGIVEWTSIEANLSIICGQYLIISPIRSSSRQSIF